MPRRKSIVSQMYRAARIVNNTRAVTRGPAAAAKRAVRYEAARTTGRSTSKLLRWLGMK